MNKWVKRLRALEANKKEDVQCDLIHPKQSSFVKDMKKFLDIQHAADMVHTCISTPREDHSQEDNENDKMSLITYLSTNLMLCL